MNRSQVIKIAKPYANAVRGGIAFRAGQDPTSCPYPLCDPEWRAWWYGWSEAFDRRFNRA